MSFRKAISFHDSIRLGGLQELVGLDAIYEMEIRFPIASLCCNTYVQAQIRRLLHIESLNFGALAEQTRTVTKVGQDRLTIDRYNQVKCLIVTQTENRRIVVVIFEDDEAITCWYRVCRYQVRHKLRVLSDRNHLG